uniref:Uncharacterized protein n=1 Tax=Ornithodoros erraticus TaxID=265619 RepID=A0A293MMP5_ORNER
MHLQKHWRSAVWLPEGVAVLICSCITILHCALRLLNVYVHRFKHGRQRSSLDAVFAHLCQHDLGLDNIVIEGLNASEIMDGMGEDAASLCCRVDFILAFLHAALLSASSTLCCAGVSTEGSPPFASEIMDGMGDDAASLCCRVLVARTRGAR